MDDGHGSFKDFLTSLALSLFLSHHTPHITHLTHTTTRTHSTTMSEIPQQFQGYGAVDETKGKALDLESITCEQQLSLGDAEVPAV